jgi:hypothetical protein
MVQLRSWGRDFELKFDSRPCLDFKGVFCMAITDPPVAQLAYKTEQFTGRQRGWIRTLNKWRFHPKTLAVAPFMEKEF